MSQRPFRIVALIALLVGISKIFHIRAWKMVHESGERPWSSQRAGAREPKPWRRPHSHRPPWFRRWAEPQETAPAGPDAEIGAADTAS